MQNVTILAPVSAVIPSPVLTVPAIVNPCAAFQIDPSLSSGSGGRMWSSVKWNVSSTSVSAAFSAATLAVLLNSQVFTSSTLPPLTLGADALVSADYLVTLTLANFLGKSASTTIRFYYGGSVNTPSVTILGPNTLTVFPKSALKFTTNATLSSCLPGLSSLNFSWSVTYASSGIPVSGLQFTMRNPRVLSIPSYQLAAGNAYTIRVTVMAARSGYPVSSAYATVTVNVLSGVVAAQLANGNANYITKDLVVDGSSSYDENSDPSTSSLSFSWLCTTISLDRYGQDCSYVFNASSAALTKSQISQRTVYYALLNVTSLYQITLVVTAPDGRYSSANTQVKGLSRFDAQANAEVVIASSLVNAESFVTVMATIVGNTDVVADWTAVQADRTINLASMALTQTHVNFSATIVASSVAFPLKYYTGSLTAGTVTTLALTLRSLDSQLLSYSRVEVTINGPPTNGALIASPSQGFALNTTFYVVTSSWEDDSLPILYDFRYLVVSTTDSSVNPFLLMQSISSSGSANSLLPAGTMDFNYSVCVFVRAYDVFGANASASTTVHVVPLPSVTPSSVTTTFAEQLQRAFDTYDNNLATTSANNVAKYFTSVNCTATPLSYCTSLHREACASIANTCGRCRTGYSGILGASNAPCMLTTNNTSPIGGTCTEYTDCLFGYCDVVAGTCAEPLQQCPSQSSPIACSGHGVCQYRSRSNPYKVYSNSSCGVLSTDCQPTCSCMESFGGQDCSLSREETEANTIIFDRLCEILVYLANMSDPSPQLLDSLTSILLVTSQGVDFLSQNMSRSCQTALLRVTEMAADGYLVDANYDSPVNLIQAVSNFVVPGDSFPSIDTSLSQFSRGVLGAISNGEAARLFESDNVQLEVRRSLVSEFANTRFAFPRSAQESAYNVTPARLQLVHSAGTYCANSDGYVQMTSAKWSTNPFVADPHSASSLIRTEIYANPDVEDYPAVDLNQPVMYYTLPYVEQQRMHNYSIEERLLHPGLNNTIPECSLYNPETRQYESCGACQVSHYDNDTVTFAC